MIKCPLCNKDGISEYLSMLFCEEHKDNPPLYQIKNLQETVKEHTRYINKDNPKILDFYNKEWSNA